MVDIFIEQCQLHRFLYMNIIHQNRIKTRLNDSSYDRNNKQTVKNIEKELNADNLFISKIQSFKLTPSGSDEYVQNTNNIVFNVRG